MPSREEVEIHSEFPLQYYDEYFISWGEVCAAARTTGMTERKDSKTTVKEKKEQLSLFSSKR